MIDAIEFAVRLLCKTSALRTRDFTGLGVIFYLPPARLPVVPLGRPSEGHYDYPVVGEDRIAQVLAEIADLSSPLHDGFHLVDADIKGLTMTAQFVAPPLPPVGDEPPSGWPSGARQMTALLVSNLETVAAVGLLSAQDVIVFSRGAVVRSVQVPTHE